MLGFYLISFTSCTVVKERDHPQALRARLHVYIFSYGMGICLSNVLSMRPTTMNRCIKQLHCSLLCTKDELYATLHRSHSPSLSWRPCLALSCYPQTIHQYSVPLFNDLYRTYPVTFSMSLRIVSVIFSFIPRFFCMASGPAKRAPPNFCSTASRPLSR